MHVEAWIASEQQVGVDRRKEVRPFFTCKNTNTVLVLVVQACHPSYSNFESKLYISPKIF